MPHRLTTTRSVMDWDKLRIFHAVADAGSFTHAGETLHLSQSAVSRQISSLEASLNVLLFHRHARGLILTEQGEELYATAKDIFTKLAMTEARIKETREKPQGPLTITCTIGFGSTWLTSRMKDFLNQYPDIELSLILTDTELDLAMREADVAIRVAPPRQGGLIQRRLVTMHLNAYASPAYLEEFGTPETAADLDDHRIVVYGRENNPPIDNLDWLLDVGRPIGEPRRPCLTVNNAYGIYRAIRTGIGVGSLPEFLGNDSQGLVQILPDLTGPTFDTFFVYPEELRASKRIAVFRDFLLSKISKQRM